MIRRSGQPAPNTTVLRNRANGAEPSGDEPAGAEQTVDRASGGSGQRPLDRASGGSGQRSLDRASGGSGQRSLDRPAGGSGQRGTAQRPERNDPARLRPRGEDTRLLQNQAALRDAPSAGTHREAPQGGRSRRETSAPQVPAPQAGLRDRRETSAPQAALRERREPSVQAVARERRDSAAQGVVGRERRGTPAPRDRREPSAPRVAVPGSESSVELTPRSQEAVLQQQASHAHALREQALYLQAAREQEQLAAQVQAHEQAESRGAARAPFGANLGGPSSVIGSLMERRQHIDLATRVFAIREAAQEIGEAHPTEARRQAAPRRPPQEAAVEVELEMEVEDASAAYAQPRAAAQGYPAPGAAQAFPPPVAPPAAYQPAPARPAARAPAPEPAAPEDPATLGQIVAFFSCRGGTGSTVLAANVGTQLAAAGLSTCLVDLDLQLGEALTVLGVEPGLPLSSLARDLASVDWEMLSPRLARHPSGLCALSQTGHVEDLAELDATRIPSLLQHLRRQFQVVLVDGLRDFNDHALAALDVADRVILVATQDVPAIRGAARRLGICRRLGYPAEKFQLVLNRFDRKNTITPAIVAEEIGIEPAFTIANDFPTVDRAINEGLTLRDAGPASEVTRQVTQLTRELFGLAPEERPGFWSRLRRKR